METDSRAALLFARLIDLHRRKTEAELLGHDTAVYDALIEAYKLELAQIEEVSAKPTGNYEAA